VVTNLPAEGFPGDDDRSRFIPARLMKNSIVRVGDMENQLKQQVLDLQADRLSHAPFGQQPSCRLWLATCWLFADGTVARRWDWRERSGHTRRSERALEVV